MTACASRPASYELQDAVREAGSIRKAAPIIGVDERTLRRWLKEAQADEIEPGGVTVTADTATITEPPTPNPKLGDIGQLIRERGLDPDEWEVVSTTLNEWDGPVAGGGLQRLKQWKVVLKRKAHLVLALPAIHIPRVPTKPKVACPAGTPELIVVEGDHQVPYVDPILHERSLAALEYFRRNCNLTEHVFLGDTGDFPTISKYADHPAAMAEVNDVIQGVYDILRDKREVAPDARARKLKGNHDWRVEGELLSRSERMYGIKPASIDGSVEIPALSLRRLLHLDQLDIELIEDSRGWEHAEIELVAGVAGLVVRHGWMTGSNTAGRSLNKRGRSMLVGHTHSREHVFQYDPSAGLERQAVVVGPMCLVRDQRFPHFAVCDGWLPGFATVTRWPDGAFVIDHAAWDGKTLKWRDQRW